MIVLNELSELILVGFALTTRAVTYHNAFLSSLDRSQSTPYACEL